MPRVWDSPSTEEAISFKSLSEATPILVNCSASSDETESSGSSDLRESSTGSTGRSSVAGSTAANYLQPTAIPATHITAAEMQKGRYKTGVRYCVETWPDNIILRVRCQAMHVAKQQLCLPGRASTSACARHVFSGVCHYARCRLPQ
jgi:hypothetical protein